MPGGLHSSRPPGPENPNVRGGVVSAEQPEMLGESKSRVPGVRPAHAVRPPATLPGRNPGHPSRTGSNENRGSADCVFRCALCCLTLYR